MDLEILREMEVLALKELTIYLRRQCNPVNCNSLKCYHACKGKKSDVLQGLEMTSEFFLKMKLLCRILAQVYFVI